MKITWSIKRIAAVALGCVLLGLAGLLILYQTGAIDSQVEQVELTKTADLSQIHTLSIATDTADTVIVPSSDNQLRVQLAGKTSKSNLKNVSIDITQVGNGQMKVVAHPTKRFQIGFNINDLLYFHQRLVLTVELPDQVYKSLKVESDTGDMDVPAIRADNLELRTDTGEIILGGFQGNKLSMSTDTGTLRLSRITASELSLSTDTGHIVADLDELKGPINAKTDTGDIEITMPQAFPSALDLQTDTGRVSIGQLDPFKAETKEKHKVKGTVGNGGPLIKGRADTGDITIEIR